MTQFPQSPESPADSPGAAARAALARPLPCVIVSGPRGAGKTRWIQRQILGLAAREPAARFAVLLGEEGRTRMERFARETPGVTVHRLLLPCFCCPGLAEVGSAVGALVAASGASRLFIEVPAVGAPGLVAEFDRLVGWPRRLLVLLDGPWAAGRRDGRLLYYQTVLFDMADAVAESPEEADRLGEVAPGPAVP